MKRFVRWTAAAALAACLGSAVAGESASPPEPLKLRFDPGFVLAVVAQRMNVTLREEVPLPAVNLESSTPLARFQRAMAGQWPFTPPLIANSYSIATNEIYLSDDASFYRRFNRSLDDSLAHEFVHYIQAQYFREDLTTDSCEVQAAEIQQWFREEYVRANRAVAAQPAGLAVDTAPACRVVWADDGTRTVRCGTEARPGPG
jgi:hypothetical protein